MKGTTKGIIAGALIASVLAGGAVGAKKALETISVTYDDIEIYMDGVLLEPKDANGNTVEPFIYNGTTYLPVRAISESIGKTVAWDGVEKVVYLGAKPGEEQSWMDVCKPYQYLGGYECRFADNEFFTMSGKKYSEGFVVTKDTSEVLFNLDGKFNSVSFTVGHIDGDKAIDAKMDVYIDGTIGYTTTLKYDDVARKITIPLNGALQMKIVVNVNGSNFPDDAPDWGFSEGVFK